MHSSTHRFFFVVAAFLFVANVYIYVNRDRGFVYTEKLSRPELYQVKEEPRLLSVHYDAGILKCWLNNNRSSSIHLQAGKKAYPLLLQGIGPSKDTAWLEIEYTPKQSYVKAGNSLGDNVSIISCTIPYGDYSLRSINDWSADFNAVSKQQKDQDRQWMQQCIAFETLPTDQHKIEALGAFLLSMLEDKRGIPSDALNELPPPAQWKMIMAAKSKVWCTQFSQLFAYYANLIGIPTRIISTENNGSLANHSFNECYVRKSRKWVFVDLTSRTLLARDSFGNCLNTLEILGLGKSERTRQTTLVPTAESKTISDALSNGISQNKYKTVETSYSLKASFYAPYFNEHTQLRYYFTSQFDPGSLAFTTKIKKYFVPHPDYAYYAGQTTVSNAKFYVRQAIILLLIFTLLLWGSWTVVCRMRERGNQRGNDL